MNIGGPASLIFYLPIGLSDRGNLALVCDVHSRSLWVLPRVLFCGKSPNVFR